MQESDFDRLWTYLTERFRLGPNSVHGPSHWKRVEQAGIRLAAATEGAEVTVVRLFAVFHDAERWDELSDLGHGPRAAALLKRMHPDWFDVSPPQLELLFVACRDHTEGDVSDDPTIGCCWDADRLDLPRVGIMPHSNYMSTLVGKRLATHRGDWSDFDRYA